MTRSKPMQGFSLIEVLVALIVIAIGMLGIAKMQGLALSSTNASRSRALAALEASSLAAAMQANRNYWSNTTNTPSSILITTSAGIGTPSSTNAALSSALGNVGGDLCSGLGTNLSCYCAYGQAGAPCTVTNGVGLAASDIYDFAQSLASFLPASSTTVSCNSADTPIDCTINITWNENSVALNSQEAAQSLSAGSTVPVSYILYVVP